MYLFDGKDFARQKEGLLATQLSELYQQKPSLYPLRIVSVLFSEDAGSVLYTRLKKVAAARVGIEYVAIEHSLLDPITQIVSSIRSVAVDDGVIGIIIQKPLKQTWAEQHSIYEYQTAAFQEWWGELVAHIPPEKDIDGLHPATLVKLRSAVTNVLLPATCKAVLSIMENFPEYFDISGKRGEKIAIIGRSEILGEPLYYVLRNLGSHVELLGKADLDLRKKNGKHLHEFKAVVSATGSPELITAEMISQGTALIDVGAPSGDIDQNSVAQKAAFLTPVPGGVGPVTVVSLLQNAALIAYSGA